MQALVTETLHTLQQLKKWVGSVSPDLYTYPIAEISHGTVGQHIRHIIEFYQEFLRGVDTSTINYDSRARNVRFEQNPTQAAQEIDRLKRVVGNQNPQIELHLAGSYAGEPYTVRTTVGRELIMVTEHAVHHMALIKAALRSIGQAALIPADFGVAASTLAFAKGTS